ncbi:sugar ABC transporter substrate-binding protein [Pseudodonghicola flavimaris]|uniref:Sugar ABC transporter substrate-binding protein n=1 Tax=Pseudodonghicola flavimaris TaxID=3050036 RepID=A0ABT7F913_9RHOB|nr:sugar ABC transporter substrate-binding protein [Pseudodonghicola flavimaris]MDK3020849.1 sugar ABC transporter substrate-binding protein [Pseudodonghicola flavimaris]
MKSFLTGVLAALTLTTATAGMAPAKQFDDGLAPHYYSALKGKKVVFLPLAMSFDLPQVWAQGMETQAERLGYELSIRDPNWSSDAGAQALTTLISEKPDLMVVHNPDMQVYARLLARAQKAGIKVIQINLKSVATTDAYVGVNWYEVGEHQARMAISACSPEAGGSGKIAIMQGTPTNPNNAITMSAIEDVLADHPEIEVVSSQSADWDATKAHSVASTVIKQNPDLCAYVGLWEVMDAGVAAAIREADKVDAIKLFTNGGGQKPACDSLANGAFTGYVSYDAFGQARDLTNAIAQVMQSDLKPGEAPYALYTPIRDLTKDTMRDDSCWTMDDVAKAPF